MLLYFQGISMNKVIIREIRENDINNIFEMMKVFYKSQAVLFKASDEIYMRDINSCIDKTNPFITGFVIEYDGNTAGYSMITRNYSTEAGGLTLWIEDLYIKPEYRKKGIGTKFFSFIEEKYKGEYVRLRLEVEEENKSAISVYKKCGYEKLPYIQMIKNITS